MGAAIPSREHRARVAVVIVATGAVVFLATPAAIANGRFPASNQIAFSPSDPKLVVARTTFGILLSHDAGSTWSWLCEDVLGITSTSIADPILALTAAGEIVAAPQVTNGLVVSADTGCNWRVAGGPMRNELVQDLVVLAGAPDTVFALTSTYGPQAGADGGPGYAQPIYESTDDGESWSAIGAPIDPSALATAIDVAPSDMGRIYVTAVRTVNATRMASLFVSTDAGAHWIERPAPFDPNAETGIYIAAVDPTNADHVYLRTAGTGMVGSPSRLIVTSDAGQNFQVALTLQGEMLGFALSPDGSKVYAGNVEQGLFVSTPNHPAYQNMSAIPVRCLATHGADLWACSDEQHSGFVAGVSSDDGATFTARLHLLAPPLLACAADATATVQCSGAPLQALCSLLTGCGSDAGTAPAVSTKACGCSIVGQAHGTGATTAAGLLAAFALGARRRVRAIVKTVRTRDGTGPSPTRQTPVRSRSGRRG
jgi:hypothetical protein